MTQESTYTPLQLKPSCHDLGFKESYFLDPPGQEFLIHVKGKGLAEFLQRACNSHASLLAALEKIANPEEASDECSCYWDSGVRLEQCDTHEPRDIAERAIKEARP